MPGGWFGLEATEEQERNWAAKRAAAKLVRASDGDARAAKKQRKIDSGGYANPATRCGVYHPSYLWDGKPPRIGQQRNSRGSGTTRPGSRPNRVPHATVPSSEGPTRKHTAEFEPDSWSWAQMTSGLGPPKRILSEEPCSSNLFRGQIEYKNRQLKL